MIPVVTLQITQVYTNVPLRWFHVVLSFAIYLLICVHISLCRLTKVLVHSMKPFAIRYIVCLMRNVSKFQ